jgi:rhamnogalacturonyl hydrolase YesR
MIIESIHKLEQYAQDQKYSGFDPYDGLLSHYVTKGSFKKNRLIRFGLQQLVKRSPINLRNILRIPKGINPVSLGLFIHGYSNMLESKSIFVETYLEKIHELTADLESMIPNGYAGACWGYNFDWEARHAKIPAYSPTVVATGIITNGLYKAWLVTKDTKFAELITSAADFVLYDLNRCYDGDTFCFSYSPKDSQRVFNASMKGVRILSQAYAITGDGKFKAESQKAVSFVHNHQNQDGSWYYSLANKGKWIDNYHTGYILDCLDEYVKLSGDKSVLESLNKGFNYYKKTFFLESGRPKFYSNNIYPADCTSASQSILTLIRFGDMELARKVADWTIQNMQTDLGNFEFRHFRFYKIKTPFMRWSDAWMYSALTEFFKYQDG